MSKRVKQAISNKETFWIRNGYLDVATTVQIVNLLIKTLRILIEPNNPK